MKQRNSLFIALAIVVMLTVLPLSAIGCAAGPGGSSGPVVITYGSGTTTSSQFLQGIAYMEVINKYAPGMRVDQVSVPGTEAKVVLLGRGDLNFAGQMSYESLAWAYYSLFDYKDKPPMKNLRTFHLSAANAMYNVVRVDSGVKTIFDLEGKTYAPGAVNTAAYLLAQGVINALGIKITEFKGGFNDIVIAIKDRRCVGMCKTMSGYDLDAQVLDIQSFTPVEVIGFDKATLDKGLKDIPGVARFVVPAGAIKALPTKGSFETFGVLQLMCANSDLPMDIGYKMIKAATEHWSEIQATYTPAKSISDPSKFTIDSIMSTKLPVPLHAGVVKYYKEIGITVPPELIPPEYK
jgi:TRAP transporter TAXI family solute receptor